MTKKTSICNYCKEKIDKPYRVGPELRYCNWECYARHGLTMYPDTPLAEMLERLVNLNTKCKM